MWRARVQSAIKKLPRVLKSFGAIMYSPTTEFCTDDCEIVHEALQIEFFKDHDKEDLTRMQGKRIVRLKLLMYAAMRHHRDVAFGGGATLGGPAAISRFLYHMYAERLPDTDQWYKRWQPDWEKMLNILDSMEEKRFSQWRRYSMKWRKKSEWPEQLRLSVDIGINYHSRKYPPKTALAPSWRFFLCPNSLQHSPQHERFALHGGLFYSWRSPCRSLSDLDH